MPGKLITRRSWFVRYGAALAAVGAGLLLRLALTAWVGPSLATYITFYPAVMAVALLAGFGPGLLATAVTVAATDYWILPPHGFGAERLADIVGMGLFSLMGLFMSLVAGYYRRARVKAEAFDREEALRETRLQNEWLASVLERAAQPFAVGYPAGRIGLVNRAFAELTGYNAEELRGMDWGATLTPSEWRDLERQKLEELHRTGQPVRYEKEYVRKDGRRVPIELLVHLARDAEGKPEYYYSFLTDLTERKQAEKDLRRSREDLARAQEVGQIGSWRLDVRVNVLSWSDENHRIFGVPKGTPLTYETFLGTIHPADRQYVDTQWNTALRGEPYDIEHRIVVDKRVKWVREKAFLEFDEAGGLLGGFGITQDITVRKQAEEQLRESAAQLQAANLTLQDSRRAALNLMEDALQARRAAEAASAELRTTAEQRRLALEAADLGAWDYHFQTGEVFWDERCREMWGIPQADKIDYARAIGAIHAKDRADVDKAVQEALAGRDGGAYHREFRVVWPDGSVHWIASHGRVYFQGEGDQRRPVRFIGANLEVTAEKQAQAALQQTAAELERSNRDLEQFAYVASHDLQEPLRAVGGYVKLLEHRFPDKLDAKAREFVAGATDGALRMERLINDLLALSRVGTHGGIFAPADLGAALDQALRNLQAGIESARAAVTHDALPTLAVDATQMIQLFQNLIGNALKFRGEAPPRIHVGVQKQDLEWVFSVRDNGIGMEPQYFERIFQVFQRLHTRRQYPGTGIGLAICKRIVERHGGKIWVESRPGQGATFYFSLPADSGIIAAST